MKLSMRTLRKSHGLTQEELAKAIGATKRQVGAWERGENDLPMDFAVAIADALECTIDDIAGRDTHYFYMNIPERPQDALTDEERDLLDTFRALDDRGRREALYAVRGIAAAHRQSGDASGSLAL